MKMEEKAIKEQISVLVAKAEEAAKESGKPVVVARKVQNDHRVHSFRVKPDGSYDMVILEKRNDAVDRDQLIGLLFAEDIPLDKLNSEPER
jgi:uncharacterized protein (DUF2126 family)